MNLTFPQKIIMAYMSRPGTRMTSWANPVLMLINGDYIVTILDDEYRAAALLLPLEWFDRERYLSPEGQDIADQCYYEIVSS